MIRYPENLRINVIAFKFVKNTDFYWLAFNWDPSKFISMMKRKNMYVSSGGIKDNAPVSIFPNLITTCSIVLGLITQSGYGIS